MPGRLIKPLHLTARAFARISGWIVLAGASLSAAGWLAGIYRLTDLANNGINISFNCAVCLILISVALLIWSYLPALRVFVWLFGGSAAIIALVTFFQYLLAVDLGIDTLLLREVQGLPGTTEPGRMGLTTSVSVAMLGAAAVLSTFTRTGRNAAVLALVAFTFAAFSLTGYAFGATQLYSLPHSTAIALQTAMMIGILALGLAAAVPEHGIARIFTGDDAGSVMVRRSLLPLIAITLLMRYLVRLGLEHAYYDREFANALVTLSEILVFTGLLWWTAQSVSEAEARSVEAQKVLAENQMHRQLAATQREARKRLAGDLHDQIGQQVTGIRLELQALCERKGDDTPLADEINVVCDHLKKLDADISKLAWELRPAGLESEGLVPSLTRFVREWSERSGIAFDFHSSSATPELSNEKEDHLYRITQEALNNILKHADATRVGMTLNFTDDDALLTIEDNGRGFMPVDSKSTAGGFGLTGMRERAESVGGRLDIESTPGEGTTVFVSVPIARGPGHADADDARAAAGNG
jgi:signal transduction histidine kinase